MATVTVVNVSNGRAFANAVAQANERYGVPLETIAGFTGHDAARWKQGRSLPNIGERRAAISRIHRALEMHTVAS